MFAISCSLASHEQLVCAYGLLLASVDASTRLAAFAASLAVPRLPINFETLKMHAFYKILYHIVDNILPSAQSYSQISAA